MKCPRCEAVLDGDSKFCVSCGANLVEIGKAVSSTPEPVISNSEETQTPQNLGVSFARQKTDDPNGKKRITGLIVGTFFIAVGILRIITAGTSISATSFGGDFYTYTYEGIVAISEMLAAIEVSLGWVIVAIGAAIDVSELRH